jgi:carbon-monoxide dehydrogenase iron sulfur subunit
MPQKEIFVRIDRCMGCHSCELACAIEHSASKALFAAITDKPAPRKLLYVEPVKSESVPVLCRHCEDAPCVHACICGAISISKEGNVLTDSDKCIGCWTCVMVCPYGVIGRNMEGHKSYRCDRCPDRDVPACVEACPTRALVFQTVEGFSKNMRRAASSEMVAGRGG